MKSIIVFLFVIAVCAGPVQAQVRHDLTQQNHTVKVTPPQHQPDQINPYLVQRLQSMIANQREMAKRHPPK